MSEFIDTYFKLLFSFDQQDLIMAIGISIYIGYLIVKTHREYKKDPEFLQCNIIDNKVEWVYNNTIYYADIVDNKIDMSTRKKISL